MYIFHVYVPFCYQKDEKQRLSLAEEELQSIRYHPLRDHKPLGSGNAECNIKSKKLKRCKAQSLACVYF